MTIKILLVDDEPSVLVTLRRAFARHDDLVVVGEGADGESAVDLATGLQPDVIVMDVHMPKVSGLAAARRLRDTGNDVPILFLTADTEASVRETDLGNVRLMLKAGVRMSDMVAAVRDAAATRVSRGRPRRSPQRRLEA